jgi:hypothetical protein
MIILLVTHSCLLFITADTRDHQHKIIGNFSITRAIILDYFIYHRFRPIVRLYFLDYSDNFLIRQVGFSDVFNPIAKVIK